MESPIKETNIGENVVDLKKILSGKSEGIEEDKSKSYKLSDRMQLMMNFVDEERDNLKNQPWSKLDKSKKYKLLGEYIDKFSIDNKISDESKIVLTSLITKSLSNNLLNKQSDVNYNIEEQRIERISILFFNKHKNQYDIKIKENNSRVTTKSKTNIDRLACQSKKKKNR